mmetsp:Transcript_58800/g.119711  ORF Transcript_58800/g.119711 Transcript_58800/m.119711 type:complete len:211 (+) Transcript_58800:3658-4290(+)
MSIESRDVGARPSHIEADHRCFRRSIIRCLRVAHNSTRWSTQNCLVSTKVVHRSQSSIRLHKLQGNARKAFVESALKVREVGRDFGCQIGRCRSRVTPRNKLDHRHDLVTHRDLFEATHLASDTTDHDFMIRERVRVHQSDGQRSNALITQSFEFRPYGFEIGNPLDKDHFFGNAHLAGHVLHRRLFQQFQTAEIFQQNSFFDFHHFFIQ